jgi:hypothetical protein
MYKYRHSDTSAGARGCGDHHCERSDARRRPPTAAHAHAHAHARTCGRSLWYPPIHERFRFRSMVSGGLCNALRVCVFSGVILALDRMEKGQGDRSAVQEARRAYPQSTLRVPLTVPLTVPGKRTPCEHPSSTLTVPVRVPPRVGYADERADMGSLVEGRL